MLKHVVLLLFLYGIKNGSCSTPEEQTIERKEILENGFRIKKNEVGANGVESNSEEITRNFRNPVLEYLLKKNTEKGIGPSEKGIFREIRHSQTLLIPNNLNGPLPGFFINQLPQFESQKGPEEQETPNGSPFDDFWNFLKNKTESGNDKIQESLVSSPVLQVNQNVENEKEEETRVHMYPAVAVVINSFNKDGSIKNTVTHFQPDFEYIMSNKASQLGDERNKNKYNSHRSVSNLVKGNQHQRKQGIPWPFANYFPIVIKDPYLNVYNAFATSMYNSVSSMIEYGPEADICLKEKNHENNNEKNNRKLTKSESYQTETTASSNFFGEVTVMPQPYRQIKTQPIITRKQSLEPVGRTRRDTTSIFVKTRNDGSVNVTLKEPSGSDDVALPDERARSFSPVLVDTPPLSTILRPPQQESRQFLGYADKKRKAKPTKPIKEEGSSEEVGEEHEEESTSQSQESANEAVAISPPPEGASVAEAKPIGLAIAGPGGVAASKPQGTAVAGPGGLAIARPVGTAIAGVEVEGSVPIGGQQKNKKKPKQEKEQAEGDLHYVGGLTGPIGNPQPKEFADSVYYKTVKDTEGNYIQDNLFFRGRPNTNGFQLKLGLQNGKYGFIPMFSDPVQGTDRLQKRTDFPIYFHGLIGNNAQEYDQFQNYQNQF